jgi:hypothetical protein
VQFGVYERDQLVAGFRIAVVPGYQ